MINTSNYRLPTDQLIDYGQVELISSLSRSTIERRIREKKFPPKINLSPSLVRFKLSEVSRWVNDPENYRI